MLKNKLYEDSAIHGCSFKAALLVKKCKFEILEKKYFGKPF
jgi:hypothetical protein